MSKMFEDIKRWYREGLWNKKRVEDVYKKGKITKEEYEEILKDNE